MYWGVKCKNNTIMVELADLDNEFSIRGDKVYIYPLSDVHMGSSACNTGFLKYWEKLFNNNKSENKIIYLMGDMIDLQSLRIGAWDAEETAEMQIKRFKKFIKPYASYVRCMVPGNHEKRIVKDFNFDISDLIADDLGIPYNKYDITDQIIVNGKPFNIFARHDWNHGKKPVNVISTFITDMQDNRLGTDLCMVGHNHLCDFRSKPYRTMEDTIERRYFAFTGHFVDYFNSYARDMKRPPCPESFLRFELNKNCKLSHTMYNVDECCPELVNPNKDKTYGDI